MTVASLDLYRRQVAGLRVEQQRSLLAAFPKPVPPLRLTGGAMAARDELIDTRDQGCARCGTRSALSWSRHHRRFRSRSGGDEVSNGVLLCGSGTTGCHGWVHSNPVEARAEGFAVESHEDPRLVRVEHFMYGLVYLDDEGRVSYEAPELAA